MKRHTYIIRWRWAWLLMLAAVLQSPLAALAQFKLHDVEITVEINKLGNARISEKRFATVGTRGTEGYIRQNQRQGRDVGEIAVSDETGRKYKVVEPWNINLSREEKAGKCGIHEGDDGTELCWGVGEPGERIYDVRYTLTRLVKAYDDVDGFLFTFYEAASPWAQHLRLIIRAEGRQLTTEDTRVWSFNHYGTIFVRNGEIVAETVKPFASDGEKMNVMVEFSKGLFTPVTTVKGTFYDRVKKRAFEGSDYEDTGKQTGEASYDNSEHSSSGFQELGELCYYGLAWIMALIFPFFAFNLRGSYKDKVTRWKHLKRLFGNVDGKQEDWYRDLPFGGDLSSTMGVMRAVDSKLFSEVNLRRAYVLRLLHSGRLKIVNDPTPGRNMAKAFYVEKPEADPPEEPGNSTYNIHLHEFLYAAAGSDHILQPEELDDYVKAHPVECRPMVKALWRALSVRRFYIGNLKREEVNQVFGLKKYLEEFTLNNEHSLAEVQLWKEYLVYASLFGNAEQVCKDMQRVFPDFEKLSGIETSAIASDTVAMSASLAASAYTAAVYVRSYETPQERRSREAARAYAASSSSRSSGGGGSSSYRGGSGSAGGGGSGFR